MSVRFDAATDRISYSATSPPATFTLAMWIWVSVNTATNATFTRLHTTSGASTVGTFATDADGLSGPGYFTAAGSIVSATGCAVGEWRKVAYTRTGSSGEAYVNTVGGTTEKDTGAVSSTAPTGITFGGRSSGDASEWFNGRVAYARLWDSVLTQTQIEAEWASTSPVVTSGLWADWPFTTDLTDQSGNGRNLVAGSTATSTEADPPISGGGSSASPRPPVVHPAAAVMRAVW